MEFAFGHTLIGSFLSGTHGFVTGSYIRHLLEVSSLTLKVLYFWAGHFFSSTGGFIAESFFSSTGSFITGSVPVGTGSLITRSFFWGTGGFANGT